MAGKKQITNPTCPPASPTKPWRSWKPWRRRKSQIPKAGNGFWGAAAAGAAVFILLTLVYSFFFRPEKPENTVRKIFGGDFRTVNLIYSHESRRAFNGDGFSMLVFETGTDEYSLFDFWAKKLPGSVAPKNGREDWSESAWNRVPVKPDEKKFTDLALNLYMPPQDPKVPYGEFLLQKKSAEIMLLTPGNYYFYRYKSNQGRVLNVDFYIVDLLRKRLVFININT